jgi:hypothetical protein
MPGADDPGPFREIFWWGGNGTMGPIASAKLAAEFAEWDERARALRDEDSYDCGLRLDSSSGDLQLMSLGPIETVALQVTDASSRRVATESPRKFVQARQRPRSL